MEGRVRLDLFDWMTKVFGLSGIDLFIYALVYAELECSVGDLALWTGLTPTTVRKVLQNLESKRLVQHYKCTSNEKHIWEQGRQNFLFTVNEDSLL